MQPSQDLEHCGTERPAVGQTSYDNDKFPVFARNLDTGEIIPLQTTPEEPTKTVGRSTQR
jgi:hypothetical protein